MRYLMEHCTHPTVDAIYCDLQAQMPTLSRTTTIDSRNIHYDGDTRPHAHFLCRRCRGIFDVPIPPGSTDAVPATPEGFKVEHTHLYYDGLCDRCRAEEN